MAKLGTPVANYAHIPVMLAEIVDVVAPSKGEIYVDGTFGAGGYARALLEAADCQVIGVDRDASAVANAAALEDEFEGRLQVVQGRFSNMEELLADKAPEGVDAIVLDLGVSSPQIDDAERGFSFQSDGPLDMRMERTGLSAADVVNKWSEKDLTSIFFKLGEEKRGRAIAKAIVKQREIEPISRTGELAALVSQVLGAKGRAQKIHPATRTFQALRLYVNRELEELAHGLMAAERLLKPKGRLAIVSFHSLEDRIVKRFFTKTSQPPPRPSRHMPDASNAQFVPSFNDITRHGVTASDVEIKSNPRARSARLRAGERTAAPAMQTELAVLGVPQIAYRGGERS